MVHGHAFGVLLNTSYLSLENADWKSKAGTVGLVGEMDRRAARKARVRGVLFGMKYDTRDLARIASLAADGTIDPHVSKVLSLDAVRKGLDLNQRGRSHGKVILRVG